MDLDGYRQAHSGNWYLCACVIWCCLIEYKVTVSLAEVCALLRAILVYFSQT